MEKARTVLVSLIKAINRCLVFLNPFFWKKSNIKILESEVNKWLQEKHPRKEYNSLPLCINKNESFDLSLVVPVFNCEQFLEQNLHSLLNQKTHYKYEIIFINDGSTDNSLGKIQELTWQFSNIKIINQANGGLSVARNVGIVNSNAKFISFIDADDFVSLNFVQNMLDVAQKEEADVVACGFKYFVNDVEERCYKLKYKKTVAEKMQGFAWGKIYKKELFRNIKFPEKFIFEDTICLAKIFPIAKKIFVIKNDLYFYRISNPKSITGSLHSKSNKYKMIESLYITDILYTPFVFSNHNLFAIKKQMICNIKRLNDFDENEFLFCMEYIRIFLEKNNLLKANILFKLINAKRYKLVRKICKYY